MADTDIRSASKSTMKANVPDFSVDAAYLDSPQDQELNYWDNPFWSKWLGYYKKIPELKKAIDALSIWTVGKGWETDPITKVVLEHIVGWGEDSFQSILENMIVTKKINGDAYAHIIREKNKLINLKPLNPGSIRIVVGKDGMITHYEQMDRVNKQRIKRFERDEILHLCNDRIGDEIHGVSVVEACENVILARNEAMTDWKTVLHRNINPLKIVSMDTDDETKISNFITLWNNTVKDKEVLFIPKGNVEVDIPQVTLQDPLSWIQYLEGFFYQAVGVPRVIASSQEYSEASSKVGYLTFEPVYTREQTILESDLWNQLGIKLKFNRPASLGNFMAKSEAANTGQTGFQPNDTQVEVSRSE